jgi:hypothetical protein
MSKKIISLITLLIINFSLLITPVQAVDYGGIGGRPAYPDPKNTRTESIFIHNIKAGDKIEDGVKIVNNSAEKKTIIISAVDAVTSSGGSFGCAQKDDGQKEVGTWIVLSKKEVTLDSMANEIVPFTINIPQVVNIGEYNGCITMQEKKDTTSTEGKNGIQLSFRTGLRVALLVPGDIKRELKIAGFDVAKKINGDFSLHPQIKNLGNVSIDTDVDVVTKSFLGNVIARNGGNFPILRDKTSEWNFDLVKPFWGGWYGSQLIVNYDKNIGASVGIESGKALEKLESKIIWFFSFPAIPGLIIEILILLVLIFLLFLRRVSNKRKQWVRGSWVLHEVKAKDNIKDLAKKHDVSWKLLAQVNKITSPYTLSKGSWIKVPDGKKQ